jgi:acyl dehydratase
MIPLISLEIESELRSAPRPMTRERMRWYVDAQPTIAFDDGRIHTQPPTIHDDDDYAKKQGLPGIISDGMITTNWILGLFFDVFGRSLAEKGRLRTKYIAPIYEDQIVICVARLVSKSDTSDGRNYAFDVWCEDDTGKKLTVGEALIVA